MHIAYAHNVFLILALVFTILAIVPVPSRINLFYVAFACFVSAFLFLM